MTVDVAMWGRALRVIPRVSKDEWNDLDLISRWLIASRSAVLVMTFLSAAIAGILAVQAGAFDPLLWFLMTLGLVMAHATNNLMNDLVDHRKGVDRDNYFRSQYGPQPLEHGLLTTRQILTYIAVTGLVALACGAYLVWLRGLLALELLGVGAFFVIFYTWPLKYIGLGEPAVLIVWGPLMVGGGYFVITGAWSWNVVLASLPYALGVTTVLFGKHIDKIHDDTAKGIRTLPVLLGERTARASVLVMLVLQYVFVLYLIAVGFFTWPLLLVLLAIPLLRQVWPAFRRPKPDQPPTPEAAEGWPLWFVGFAFLHNRRFGSLFLLGLIVATLFTFPALHLLG